MSHFHHFTDEGININYCTHLMDNGNICPIAQDRETRKVGKFIIVRGQGVIPS